MTDAPSVTYATSFGQAAEHYDRGRPDYPAQAIEWLLPADAHDVADVGAGTGKLTFELARGGRRVVAIDPDEQMLATLTTRHPGVTSRRGTAEDLPLADHCVDAVTFAQSWHWVDPVAAAQEAARVLRPGGVLALVWNIRDTNIAWVARFNTIVRPSAAERLIESDQVHIGPPFTDLQRHTIAWTYRLDGDTLVDLAASRSAVINLVDSQRAEVLDEVRALAHQEADDAGTVHLPYRTHLYRAVLGHGTDRHTADHQPA